MGDLWAQLPLVPVSGWIVVGGLALLIVLGRYPTPGQYREMRADRDHYRAAADTLQKVTLEQGMTLEQLMTIAEKSLANDELILHVVQEIQRAGGEE